MQMPSHLVRTAFFVIVFGLSALVFSSGSFAHTELKSSEPADGANLEAAPEQLTLNFAGKVTLLKLDLRDAEGEEIALDFTPSSTAASKYSLPLPKLAESHYTLTWTALGGDGHKLEKSFSFHVGRMGAQHHEQGAKKAADEHHHH